MALRKRIKIVKGLNLNLSKSGASVTVGGKHASVNVGKKGAYVNTNIPGTGISSRKKITSSNSKNISSDEEIDLNDLYNQMSDDEKLYFNKELTLKKKNTAIGYLFWFFGLQYAYYGNWIALIAYLITFGGFGLWWLIDLFRMNSINQKYNNKLSLSIMLDILKI